MWPTGIASEEDIHGAAQLLMKSITKIRAAFTFRKKFRLSIQEASLQRFVRKKYSSHRDAAHQFLLKASSTRRLKPDKKKSQGRKVFQKEVDFVCVHIRRWAKNKTF